MVTEATGASPLPAPASPPGSSRASERPRCPPGDRANAGEAVRVGSSFWSYCCSFEGEKKQKTKNNALFFLGGGLFQDTQLSPLKTCSFWCPFKASKNVVTSKIHT